MITWGIPTASVLNEEGAKQMLGRAPNAMRTLAHAPRQAQELLGLLVPAIRCELTGELDMRLKALLILKTSTLNGCAYCIGHNTTLGRSLGFDDDLVLRALWEANDFARTSVEFRGIIDASSQEWIVEGIFQRQIRSISEDLQFEFGVQYFEPDRSEPGFFALFPNNSNVRVGLRLDF